jgi:hypothetical protein
MARRAQENPIPSLENLAAMANVATQVLFPWLLTKSSRE